jgi:ubiquinol-cytochrome c reductase cytochrome c subunit
MITDATPSTSLPAVYTGLGLSRDAAKALLLASALLFALTGGVQAQSSKSTRPSAANGKAVFMRVGCYTCHGTVGQGGAGARLAPNTIPLAAMQVWVRGGTPGWSIARGMPAFPIGVISDSELTDVQAYLASLPAPPKPDDIALLKP